MQQGVEAAAESYSGGHAPVMEAKRPTLQRPHSEKKGADIAWRMANNSLGLLGEYQRFVESGDLDLNAGLPGVQRVPMLQGLETVNLITALRDLGGVGVKCTFDTELLKEFVDDRDPGNGSYMVGLRNSVDADPDMAGMSIKDVKSAGGLNLCTLRERLVWGYFRSFQHEEQLDSNGTATVCGGSRIGQWSPTVELIRGYMSKQRKIQISLVRRDCASQLFRPRLVCVLG